MWTSKISTVSIYTCRSTVSFGIVWTRLKIRLVRLYLSKFQFFLLFFSCWYQFALSSSARSYHYVCHFLFIYVIVTCLICFSCILVPILWYVTLSWLFVYVLSSVCRVTLSFLSRLTSLPLFHTPTVNRVFVFVLFSSALSCLCVPIIFFCNAIAFIFCYVTCYCEFIRILAASSHH